MVEITFSIFAIAFVRDFNKNIIIWNNYSNKSALDLLLKAILNYVIVSTVNYAN